VTSDHRSWQERDAEAELIRVKTANVAASADADRRRREALDAPKIEAALARAAEIRREAAAKAEAEEKAKAEEKEAAAKARAEALAAAKAEAERQAEIARRDARAAKAVNIAVVAALLVALPLQLRTFWNPDRWWEVAVPFVLEGLAWVFIRLAEAAIPARRMVWHYIVGVFACSAFAATVNALDGFMHDDIGPIFGIVGGVCSIAGPGIKVVHEFAARAKAGKATWTEKKIAEANAAQAAAEAEVRKAELAAQTEAKRREADARQKAEADKRAAHEAKVAADKAAAEAALAAQDEQRKNLYPGAWQQYELILAANPLGSISRDRAWDEARRAADHPDVWDHYRVLVLNTVNVKAADLWADAWATVKGLPVGQTIESLAAKLAAREYVNQTLAEHMDAAGYLAVEELLAGIFGGGGGDGGTPAKGGPKKPRGGPSEGAAGLVSIGQEGDTAPRYKDVVEPLSEADLKAARELHDADPDGFSTPAVQKLLGRSSRYSKRVRDAITNPKEVDQ